MLNPDIKNEYDVIVVGAGPSGAAAAKIVTDKGLTALIIEKKELPRYKICSGIIFKKSLRITEEYFGKIPDSAFVTPKYLNGVRMWDSDCKYTDWPFKIDGEGAPNVWRSEYDYWLVKNSGAEILDQCKVINFRETDDHVEISCDYENKQIILKCRFLVSAEGSVSTIRAKLDPEFESSLERFFAYQNYYEGSCNLDALYYHGFLDERFGNVYAWFNIKDDLIVFGTGVKIKNKLEPYLTAFTEFLRSKFDLKLGKILRKASCVGYNMCSTNRFYLGKGNIILVGESAGFLNMFGEGISSALSTGLSAGKAICESLVSDSSAISIYEDMAAREKKYTSTSWKLAERMAGRKVI
ncbi:MAG: NAD(P)/FAD-dependent oxidoreductase [Candidatus Anammoxibacter sp.]